jgi:hypothetical protein
VAFRLAPSPRRVAADASLGSGVWCRRWRRRPIHPSGSRPRDVSPAGQTAAPGPGRAPANRRCPAVAQRRPRTPVLAPCRGRLPQGARQRRRQTPPSGGRPTVMGCGGDASHAMVLTPRSSPSPTPPPLGAYPQPPAVWTSKGRRSRLRSEHARARVGATAFRATLRGCCACCRWKNRGPVGPKRRANGAAAMEAQARDGWPVLTWPGPGRFPWLLLVRCTPRHDAAYWPTQSSGPTWSQGPPRSGAAQKQGGASAVSARALPPCASVAPGRAQRPDGG